MTVSPEFLFLVNGLDDNINGWIDEGFDGVDNNNNGVVDDLFEWEHGGLARHDRRQRPLSTCCTRFSGGRHPRPIRARSRCRPTW